MIYKYRYVVIKHVKHATYIYILNWRYNIQVMALYNNYLIHVKHVINLMALKCLMRTIYVYSDRLRLRNIYFSKIVQQTLRNSKIYQKNSF